MKEVKKYMKIELMVFPKKKKKKSYSERIGYFWHENAIYS